MINVFHWMQFSLQNVKRKLFTKTKENLLTIQNLTDYFTFLLMISILSQVILVIFWQILMYVSQLDNIILFSTRGKANFKMT